MTRFLALAVAIATTTAACENAAERKAREEAAINSGTAPAAAPSGESSSATGSTAKAAAMEAAASAPSHPALAPLPVPGDVTSATRAEIGDAVAGIECRPDISAEDCANAKASMAVDMDAMLADKQASCVQTRADAESAQRELIGKSTDLTADLDTLQQRVETARARLAADCTS